MPVISFHSSKVGQLLLDDIKKTIVFFLNVDLKLEYFIVLVAQIFFITNLPD